MRVLLTGRQVEITPTLRRLVDKRLARLERRFGEALVSAQCVLSKERGRFVVDLTVHARQDHILHGVGTTGAWGTSLTAAVQKVIQQAQKVKGKWQERKRSAGAARAPRSRRRV